MKVEFDGMGSATKAPNCICGKTVGRKYEFDFNVVVGQEVVDSFTLIGCESCSHRIKKDWGDHLKRKR